MPEDLIASLRETVLERLRDALQGQNRVALLDFPNHENAGDTAIWQGERAAFASLGIDIVHEASYSSFSPRAVRRRLGSHGTVLIHGGGNLGDVWPTFQAHREHIVRSLPDHPIVQLPQTIHFSRDDAVDAASEAFGTHPDLTIMVRDRPSEDLSSRAFTTARTMLAPDCAFALGALRAPAPVQPLVVLARTDGESALEWPGVDPATLTDWRPRDPRSIRAAQWWVSRALQYPIRRDWPGAGALEAPMRAVFQTMATARLRAGVNKIAAGRVLVTDRLHGHILALLMGRPHVVLDNSYGKVSSFRSCWTLDAPHVRTAASVPEALSLAAALETESRG